MPRVNRIPPKKLQPSKCLPLFGCGLGTGTTVEVEEVPVVIVVGMVEEVVVVGEFVVVEKEEEEVVVEVVVLLAVVTAVVLVVVVVVFVFGVIAMRGSSPPELQYSGSVMIVGWWSDGSCLYSLGLHS